MLYTKDINKVEFTDIKEFCELSLEEGLRLDYKSNFPRELAKIIAAFSNTAGGIILVGVETDPSNRPTNIPGIDYKRGLEERVTSISLSNINPPISPEVKVCPFKSNTSLTEPDKAVIVIRVQESPIAPHAIDGDVYIRVRSQCKKADLKTIETLIKKRDKSKEILNNLLKIKEEEIFRGLHINDSYRTIVVVPQYPIKPIIQFNRQVDMFLRNNIPRGLDFGNLVPTQDGVEFKHVRTFQVKGGKRDIRTRYAEIMKEGFIAHQELIDPKEEGVNIDRTIIFIGRMLEYVRSVFEQFGYYGNLFFKFILSNIYNKKLTVAPSRTLDEDYISEKQRVVVRRIISLDEVRENPKSVVKSILMEFCRAFRFAIEESVAADYVNSLLD